jgi:crotonobetaine/carnitine-CoA ligase
VPSEFGEDDVMIAVAAVEGQVINETALITFLIERMAHFMVPRYIRILDVLPKTPSSKILKHQLRDQGVTAETWDRETHKIHVKRDRKV